MSAPSFPPGAPASQIAGGAHALAADIRVERGRRSRRHSLVTISLATLAFALFWMTLAYGEKIFTPVEIVGVIAGNDVPGASFAVGEIRLPKALLGMLVGMAMGMAGHASQTMLRNQLASPDIIGITSGASASAVFAILVLDWSGMRVTVLALIAGITTALLIYLLATPGILGALWAYMRAAASGQPRPQLSMGSGSAQGGRLILIGIGVSAMFTSLISYLQLEAKIYDVNDALRWLSGSLSAAQWGHVPFMTGALIIFGSILLWRSRDLSLLAHGNEAATALGVPVNAASVSIILALVGLASASAAATGPIAFLSFLAGPITVRLLGPVDRSALIPAALMGACLVLGADLVGQHLAPVRLPVGVVTSLIGAPYLLTQLIRINRQGTSA